MRAKARALPKPARVAMCVALGSRRGGGRKRERVGEASIRFAVTDVISPKIKRFQWEKYAHPTVVCASVVERRGSAGCASVYYAVLGCSTTEPPPLLCVSSG